MTLDVAIIGAGISGINTAYRLHSAHPGASYRLFESRSEIGGTWSFFKYPGLRSDSDLFSFGFEWNPWPSDQVIADAASIMGYLDASMRSFGADRQLELGHRLVAMSWDSGEQLWTLVFDVGQKQKEVKARWVVLGTGYYDYASPLETTIPGLEHFRGRVVHPQFWPDDADLDVSNKRIAIVGSGATAITILPHLAHKAAHVTLIQRSPSYIASLPRVDRMATVLKRWLPRSWAMRILRIKYLVLSFLFYNYCQRFPTSARRLLGKETKKMLPPHIGLEPHFTPRYGPWDQRLCMCPDGDFYAALRSGKASIVTGHIAGMSEASIDIVDQPESRVDADILVTATGLRLLVGGGARIIVDGIEKRPSDKMLWKGCMVQDVPNLVAVIGYTNASWTLGADVAAKTFTRLYKEVEARGAKSATPALAGPAIDTKPFMQMQSTYLLKGRGSIPTAGNRYPWLPRGNYFSDMWDAAHGSITTDIRFAG